MNDDAQSQEHLPTVRPRRAYEVQAEEYYPLDPMSGMGGGEGLDVRRLVESLWRWKWLIAGCTVLGIAGGLVAAQFVEPEYEVEATVWLEQDQQGRGPLRAEDPLAGEGWSSVFRSTAVVHPVIRDMQLYLRPRALEGVDRRAFDSFRIDDGAVGGDYTLRVDADRSYELSLADTSAVERGTLGGSVGESFGFSWTPPVEAFEPEARATFRVRTMQQTIEDVRSALSVRYDDDAGIFHASFTWKNRDEAAPVLNRLQDQFITTATDLKNAQLRETVSILETQTDSAYSRLAGAEAAYQNFRVGAITQPSERQLVPSPDRVTDGGGSMTGSDPVFGQYFETRLERRQLEHELEQLRRIRQQATSAGQVDMLSLMSLTSAGDFPVLQATLDTLNAKEARRGALLATFTEQADTVQFLTDEIRHLKTVTIPSQIDELIEQVQQRTSSVDVQLDTQAEELRGIPGRTIEQARLEREMEAAARLHENLQASLKEAELAEATSSPGLQVLDRAAPPLGPTSDTVPQIMLMATMAGLGLGLAGALLLDKMDKRIRYPDQVERGLGLPVLGIVPRLDAGSGVDANVAVESFRSIRVQISHSNGTSKGLVLVTSPAPRDGKSMVSANLAISYASAGYRTVMVDADVRRGHAEDMFEVQRSPGLADYLRGEATAEEIRQETKIDGLTMIAKGTGRNFNLELLDSVTMDELLQALKSDFDVVVLDAPPLAAGADALVLGRRSDKVVMVLRAGETDEVLARTKLELIGNVDVPIVGAVLNAVPTSSHYYPYYANYYYEAEPV
ncbi:MAG: polysaccharide biosynthesis tyrosine autokinase [Gemmatimonadota bacterium]